MSGMPTGLLTRPRRLHFIGVGGTGMSGVAELCQRLGFEVSGCDLHGGATTERLATWESRSNMVIIPATSLGKWGVNSTP